jgi:hypothetical protein
MTIKAPHVFGFCVMALCFGGYLSSFHADPVPPKAEVIHVPAPAVTTTKVTTVHDKVIPQACLDMISLAKSRDDLMAAYQSKVVSAITDVPNELSRVSISDDAQGDRNKITQRMNDINEINITLQVDMAENKQSLAEQTTKCNTEVR